MVRIRCAVVIRHVARIAIGRRPGVPICVALVAARIHMLTRQWEPGVVVVEGRRHPCGGFMALRAIRRESRLDMVR